MFLYAVNATDKHYLITHLYVSLEGLIEGENTIFVCLEEVDGSVVSRGCGVTPGPGVDNDARSLLYGMGVYNVKGDSM